MQVFLGTLLSLMPVLWTWVTAGQASKGSWGPFCHMLFFRKKVVKDRQMKKIPQKKNLASEGPPIQKEKAPKQKNEEIENTTLQSIKVQRALTPMILGEG